MSAANASDIAQGPDVQQEGYVIDQALQQETSSKQHPMCSLHSCKPAACSAYIKLLYIYRASASVSQARVTWSSGRLTALCGRALAWPAVGQVQASTHSSLASSMPVASYKV